MSNASKRNYKRTYPIVFSNTHKRTGLPLATTDTATELLQAHLKITKQIDNYQVCLSGEIVYQAGYLDVAINPIKYANNSKTPSSFSKKIWNHLKDLRNDYDLPAETLEFLPKVDYQQFVVEARP